MGSAAKGGSLTLSSQGKAEINVPSQSRLLGVTPRPVHLVAVTAGATRRLRVGGPKGKDPRQSRRRQMPILDEIARFTVPYGASANFGFGPAYHAEELLDMMADDL